MFRTRSMLALSASLLAGAASAEAHADGTPVGRDNRPAAVSAVQKESDEENAPAKFTQPLAAKLATASAGGAAGGTSRATSKVTFSNGNTDAQADVEIDL